MENTGRSCKGLDLKRNYYALYLSIVQKKSVSESLSELNIVSGHGKSKRRRSSRKEKKKMGFREYNFTEEELKKIIKRKERETYDQIAKDYECSMDTIALRVKEYMMEKGIWEQRAWKREKRR